MLKKLHESIEDGLMAVIGLALLVAAAAGSVTFAYTVFMACYRLIGSLREHLFFPWP